MVDIKVFRKKIGYSQRQLSDATGIPKSRISQWELGNGSPKVEDTRVLTNFFAEMFPDLDFGETLKPIARKEDNAKHALIPLYDDVITFGGFKEDSNTSNGVERNNGYIDAGGWFKGATAALRHYGDSMEEYPSGCILALRELKDKTDFIWGQNYVIEYGEDYNRVTKTIQKGNDEKNILAYSTNEDTHKDGRRIHEPKKIALAAIKRSFIVLGRVVKEHSITGVVLIN